MLLAILYSSILKEDQISDSNDTLIEEIITCRDGFDRQYFRTLVKIIIDHQNEIDQAIEAALERKTNKLPAVELAILRMATAEIVFIPKIPAAILISEALNLAELYGGKESYKYINFALNQIALKHQRCSPSNKAKAANKFS